MSLAKRSSVLAIGLMLLASIPVFAEGQKVTKEKPFRWKTSGTFKTGDTYYGKNISLLNNCIPEDKVFYVKHSLDLNADLAYRNLLKSRFSLRSKAVWGSPEVAPTTTEATKIMDSVGQQHKHFLPRHVLWMREAWLEFLLNEAIGLSFFDKPQLFTLGAFPFQLGRGIALGDAYAVSPNYLGFYSDTAVDQYAFGGKLSGGLAGDWLSYDLYGAILNNLSNSLSKTGQKILGQQYGKLEHPERGFGKINFVIAGRLNILALDDEKKGNFSFEPYFLYNSDPEQQVDFVGDASSELGTIGVAGEFESQRFEFGFDAALNLGSQKVKGWDRNKIELQNRNGVAQEINSHVYVNVDPLSTAGAAIADLSPYQTPYVSQGINTSTRAVSDAGATARKIVNGAARDEVNNGKSIGTVSDLNTVSVIPVPVTPAQEGEMFNAINRFRDPYKNQYKGWMLVTDVAGFFYDRDVRIAATFAYASGDQDPNHEQKDCDYEGFIGLQELYAGKRVKSAFFLGGAGKLRLPLDIPSTETQPNRFGVLTSGFTNLAVAGTGFAWEPHDWKKSFFLNPNILAYWQTHPQKKFDLENKTVLDCPARSFLGVEFNLFIKKELLKNLKIYGIISVFVPGSHFEDVRGKPLNAAQWKVLDRIDVTGFNEDVIPGLGKNISGTFNAGFEYKF